MAATQSNANLTQVAIGPVNTIHPKDLATSAAGFDAWLQEQTGGAVTLERIRTVAGGLPVVGNIIALADVLDDIITMMRSPKAPDVLMWASLGINLIGVVPLPAGTAAARMSLRPMLALVREEMIRQASQGLKAELGHAVVSALATSLNATIVGDIENFVTQSQAKLTELLNDAGEQGEKMLLELANGLERAVSGKLDSSVNVRNANQHMAVAGETLLHDPKTAIVNFLQAEYEAYKAGGKEVLNLAARIGLTQDTHARFTATLAKLRAYAPQVRQAMQTLAAPQTQQGIMAMLVLLASAIKTWKAARAHQATNVPAKQAGRAHRTQPGQPIESRNKEHHATGSAGCKNCPAPTGTGPSISFATGDETLSHTDFILPGLFPIEWTRTYRSSLGAYDKSEQGARWITPYTMRFDLVQEGGKSSLLYHDADGRSHAYPLPDVGQFHRDAIEELLLVRRTDTELVLSRGQAHTEIYRRHGQTFRLAGIRLRSGAGLMLHYEHRVGDSTVLSDLVTLQGDTPHSHITTRVDKAGRITELWQLADGEPLRQLSRYQYDETGDLTLAQDENAAHWDYTYQHHLVTRYTDRTGRGMNLQWNGDSPSAHAIREWADDGSFDTRLRWDDNIRLTYVTDALGNETWHYYDILGYTYRIQHPDGRSEWLFRDDAKNVVQHIHTDGSIDRFIYDDRSNLLQHTRADGSAIHYAYDDRDQLIKIRDTEGGLWQRDYDTRGNLTEESDPLGNKTEYSYNKAGLLTEITDAKAGKKQLAYNTAGQLTAYTDCPGKTTAWKYGERGRLEKFTDAAGGVTRYEYDAGQLARLIHPDDTVERFERDAEGRLLTHIDALHRRTTWDYSEGGLISRRTDAANGVIEYQWDKLGRLTGLTNENARQISFQYDPVGRLLKQTGFDGRATQYYYDAASGILKTTVDADTLATGYAFDALGRLTQRGAGILDPKTNKYEVTQTETFAYDGNGNLALAKNEHSSLQWFHDAAGNVTREHQHYTADKTVAVWRHEYDALNRRIATIRPDGHRVDLLTYGSGHVHGIHLDGQELVGFERDDLHRETQRTQGNRLTQTQKYDTAGRLLEQTLSHLDRTTAYVNRRKYRYDTAGQLTAIDDIRRGGLSYRYDPVGRLLQANSALGQETFDFDPAGNLLEDPTLRTFPADPATGRPEFSSRLHGRNALVDNLLKQYAGTHYEWDARGNLTKRTVNGQDEYFHWDVFNRLIEYTNPRFKVHYQYDALGRRTVKRSQAHYFQQNLEYADGFDAARQARRNREEGCSTTRYGWDGDTLAWECRQEAEVEVQGRIWPEEGPSRTTHYLYEPNSFVPLAQAVRHGPMQLHQQPEYAEAEYDLDDDPLWTTTIEPKPFDSLAWYQCDHLGTPQELTDEQGDIAWSAHYKAWGQAQEVITDAARKAGIQNPIRFQGQYFDHETGLHYNRHRYYDPASGRFISKDPIGLTGGLNVYQYAPNPIGWVDPLGLARCPCDPCSKFRRASLRDIRRQLAIPMSQQPISQKMVPLTDSTGARILGDDKRPIMTRELTYRVNGKNVIIQDHSAGHSFGEGGVGDQPSHHNVRPEDRPRTGSVDGMSDHYYFDCRNKK
ncbi:RHS repeat-associated core domain-containing protein [Ralstonia sp. UBA689]|uniref:RHS repeat-associated core domain-containing protein n=1 Tax=Ralstonia sp. UBA689 TaxID=1947373 RepID=UPI0025FF32E8|nr:RHS repeat-associated core domain-containing protein [Ralstonia sp. UBA689]